MDTDNLLYLARDAQTKTAKVIKYVTKYGTEVHRVLSNAGLEPVLFDIVPLKGNFLKMSCATAFIFAVSAVLCAKTLY